MKRSTHFMAVILILFSANFLFAQGKDRAKKEKIKEEIPAPVASVVNKACGLSTEGTTREGFISDTTTADIPCPRGAQTCMGGQWVGPQLYDVCDNNTKNCGATPHGATVEGFLHATVPKGSACAPAFKTCLNGSWIGPEVVPACSELP